MAVTERGIGQRNKVALGILFLHFMVYNFEAVTKRPIMYKVQIASENYKRVFTFKITST